MKNADFLILTRDPLKLDIEINDQFEWEKRPGALPRTQGL